MEKRFKNQIKTFPPAFEILTDNSKPFESMGRKATDLKAAKEAQGGWVAEVGFRTLPVTVAGVRLLAVGFESLKEVKKDAQLSFHVRRATHRCS